MSEQVPELRVYLSLLPVGPIIERDLFTMIYQVIVLGSVLALKLLLYGSELAKGWRDEADYDS